MYVLARIVGKRQFLNLLPILLILGFRAMYNGVIAKSTFILHIVNYKILI